MLKIASWNVNSLKVRQEHVAQYLNESNIDIIGLQEIKQIDEQVDRKFFIEQGWHIETFGQKTYNGVALLSREKPNLITKGIPHYSDPQARVIAGCYNDLLVLNVYVPNGKEVGDEKYSYKLEWLENIQAYIAQLLSQYPKMIILGDFNIAPTDIDTYDAEKWQDKILCSQPERDALQSILNLGFEDAYRTIHPTQQQFSWWDYRMNGYKRKLGLRIDLTLVSKTLNILDADIDETPRQWERPSDHAPAWVTIANL